MATKEIRFTFKVDGQKTDPSSVKLSDPTDSFGVKRDDNDGVVVPDGTDMTKESVGVYVFTFTEPELNLRYTAYIEAVFQGATYRFERSLQGTPVQVQPRSLKAMRDTVIEVTGRDDKSSLIDRAINQALDRAILEHDWKALRQKLVQTVSKGTEAISVPDDFLSFRDGRILDGSLSNELRLQTREFFVTRWPDFHNVTPSKPHWMFQSGNQLFLFPKPDTQYKVEIYYRAFHPQLENDTDELLIPHLEPALIAYAAYFIFKSIEKFEESRQWFSDWRNELVKSIALDKNPIGMDRSFNFGNLRSHDPDRPHGRQVIEPWKDPFYGHGVY